MKREITLLAGFLCLLSTSLLSQNSLTGSIAGKVSGPEETALEFANVILYSVEDSSMAKVETTGLDGAYVLSRIPEGQYWLDVTYVGLPPYQSESFQLAAGQALQLPEIRLKEAINELKEVVVTAQRPMVEVRADKMIFNVENSINATGSTAFELLRKAPGVVVDNNDNISLLGRNGVQIYIDDKPSPLGAADLAAFLKTLQSTDIEAIEIITNPSAKYDAEGNAGIINIRMKKDKRLGANGNLNLGYSVGKVAQYNTTLSGNYRTRAFNSFGSYTLSDGENTNYNQFFRRQSGQTFDQLSLQGGHWTSHNFKAGTDFFLQKQHTLGFLVSGYLSGNDWGSQSNTIIADIETGQVEKLLQASSDDDNRNDNLNFNLNYRFDNSKGKVWNIDADYGMFRNMRENYQPNYYRDPTGEILLEERINSTEAPTDIDIYTFKIDHERPLLGGQLGAGIKLANIHTDNLFDFYDIYDGAPELNTGLSNRFVYKENINAGYVSYSRQIKKLGVQLGLRVEQTNTTGELDSYREGEDQRFDRHYLDFFPSGGLSYAPNDKNNFQLSYSRRINRPSYQDLNPFLGKMDELTYEQGNPFLRPEYANNIQLTHSFNYRFNTTFSFGYTQDLITRIVDTAQVDAAYITWLNLAEQYNYSLNFSAPVPVTEWWSAFTSVTGSYTENKADYGDGKTVALSKPTFNIYSQQTFRLPWDLSMEVSGWYNAPSIWGGTFVMESMWSIDAGIQKKVLDGRGNIRLSVSDIFKSNEWTGVTEFGALYMKANGGWDSRRFRVNFSYLFGNEQVKSARKRATGLEDEQNRVKQGNN
ncbi:MAG: TonB-dependent receptor [Phaeodactylibacter sp.]|nr:TonB-dependent receptor [Phaeodactylibacter sp.]